MIAPCGIEIKEGQVWRTRCWGFKIASVNDTQILAYRDTGILSNTSWTVELSAARFTNQRGGYKLVEEAQGGASNG